MLQPGEAYHLSLCGGTQKVKGTFLKETDCIIRQNIICLLNVTMHRATARQIKNQILLEQVLLTVLLGLSGFFLLLLTAIMGYQLWYAGRIYPGVSVGGIDVGGLTIKTAAARIASELNYHQIGKIVLQEGERTWLVTPAQIGLFPDLENSAKAAFSVGRTGGLYRRLSEQLNAQQTGVDVSPILIWDQRLAHDYLSALAKELDRPLIEPSLTLEGSSVVVHPGQSGRFVDIPATLNTLGAQLQTLQDGIVPLVIVESQPIIMDIEEQAEIARRILSQPLVLTLPEGQPEGSPGPWELQPTQVAEWLIFQPVVEGTQGRYAITFDKRKLRSFLSELAPKLALMPQNARFIFNDETRQLEVIQKAVIGRQLNIEASITKIQEQALTGEHSINLELTLTPPPVTDDATAEQLGITELIHSEVSYFYGSSPERVQNILAGASRFHGLLVAPGETFSMAKALGDINLDNGFAEALIILGGRTIKGVGGGICQVSTTLFRTAFFSGFPIVERHAHAYRVAYYEKNASNQINPQLAGLDATVFVPLVDFKFINDTPYWLLMETYVNPSRSTLTWKFYSTSDGRRVEWNTTGPINIQPAPEPLYRENPDLPSGEIKQVDWAADGADVTVTRIVYKGDTVHLQDTFITHYQPWQAIYEYGPGTEGMPPEPSSSNHEE
jgi:vancomycin resistance protein YoaR